MTARVSLRSCDAYEYQQVRDALAQSVQNLGGWAKFIRPGERVLLKVNLLTRKKPEDAVTTHPVVVQALADLLIGYGASVIIGDSPGGPFTASMLNGIYKATGMEAAARETGATLNANFKSCERENPQGLIMKRLTLTDMLNDADKVISVAKLKTHGMMTYTGAVKNMFGVVPGVTKAEYHLNIPDYDTFADALIDICLCASPVLSFIDGIVGMEGRGPSAGTPVHTNVLLASDSPYHLDKAACHLIGLTCEDVPILKRLVARKLITADLSDITFAGDPIEDLMMPEFDVPKIANPFSLTNEKLPRFVKRFFAAHVQTRPVVDEAICTGCGICRDNCPAKVITINNKKAAVAYPDCIRCYCCQELCPSKAVQVYRPKLSRLMRL